MPRKSSTPLALHEVIRILGAEHAYLFLGARASEQLVLRSARRTEGRELGARAATARRWSSGCG
jgi:hypothetical protein